MVFTAVPGVLAHFGAVEIVGQQSVGEQVIRRKLGYRAGELYRRSLVQDSQRTLYGLELFQFVNIEIVDPGEAGARGADARHRRRRTAISASTSASDTAPRTRLACRATTGT